MNTEKIPCLFFTRNVSLKDWLDIGLLDREKLIYEELIKQGGYKEVIWITYGEQDAYIADELKDNGRLSRSIKVAAKPPVFKGKAGNFIYSLVSPFLNYKLLKEADIIKTNQMDGAWSALVAKFLYKKPLLLRTGFTSSIFLAKQGRSRMVVSFFNLLERVMYRFCNKAVVTSRQDKEYICAKYGTNGNKVMVIHNYIDTASFYPKNKKRFDDRIVFVGRLNKQKNLFGTFTAAARAGLIVDVYGDGELSVELKNFVQDNGLEINFKGVVPNDSLADILNDYRYFILASFYEGMPKTLLEAMACGCVCIGTDVEGIREVICDGENGFLAKGTDEENIYKAIIRTKGSDTGSVSGKAVETIMDYFSLQHVVSMEKDIINSLRGVQPGET